MKSHADEAEKLFTEGYNCSQAVFAAFCDVTGLDQKTALKISSSFGGGMGRMREVCGAVTGMFMAAGILRGYDDPKDTSKRAELYALIQEMAGKFKEENGSIVCRELLGLSQKNDPPTPEARTPEYYHKRPCVEMVRCAARILDEVIAKEA